MKISSRPHHRKLRTRKRPLNFARVVRLLEATKRTLEETRSAAATAAGPFQVR